MMLNMVEKRRSIRKYLDQPVAEEKLRQILESGRLAPSGSNTQPWRFIVVTSPEKRRQLAEVSHQQQWMTTAPVFIVCVADSRCRLPAGEVDIDESSPLPEVKMIIRDTAIAVEHMALEAENQGLGSCWVAWFVQREIRPLLNLPSDKYVVAILTVGYAAEQPAPRPRKAREEIVCYETWHEV